MIEKKDKKKIKNQSTLYFETSVSNNKIWYKTKPKRIELLKNQFQIKTNSNQNIKTRFQRLKNYRKWNFKNIYSSIVFIH